MTNKRINLLLPLLLPTIAYLVFSNGLTGSFYYDDYRPLSGLLNVVDFNSAMLYVTTETSGPLGRPISMLSFLLNIGDWPNNIEGFLEVSLAIHALNGILVYWLTLQIYQKLQWKNGTVSAFLVALMWLVLPINLSAVLIPIQRMALLAGLFSLITINLYLYAKKFAETKPAKTLVIQSTSFIIFGLLAILSKESALLLPLFCFLLDQTLFKEQSKKYKYNQFNTAFFLLTLVIIFSYLIFVVVNSGDVYENRTFTLEQRLVTQLVIIADYIKLTFKPELFAYNPFHDNYPIVSSIFESWKITLKSIFTIVLLISGLYFFKKQLVIAFALLWFFIAHLLESTVIGLELYFEHRNYLAFIGPLIAISYLINNLAYKKLTSIFKLTVVLYIAILTASTYQITNLWGDKYKAAFAWHQQQTGSARASEHLALLLLENNNIEAANTVLTQQVKACRNCYGSKIQNLITSCLINDEKSTAVLYKQLTNSQNNRFIAGSGGSALTELHNQIRNENCSLINEQQLININLAFLNSKLINKKFTLPFLFNLHNLHNQAGNFELAIKYLKKAYAIKNEYPLAQLLVTRLNKAGNTVNAQKIAETLCKRSTLNPWLTEKYAYECNTIKNKVNE